MEGADAWERAAERYLVEEKNLVMMAERLHFLKTCEARENR